VRLREGLWYSITDYFAYNFGQQPGGVAGGTLVMLSLQHQEMSGPGRAREKLPDHKGYLSLTWVELMHLCNPLVAQTFLNGMKPSRALERREKLKDQSIRGAETRNDANFRFSAGNRVAFRGKAQWREDF
jgi:hypothetical protein